MNKLIIVFLLITQIVFAEKTFVEIDHIGPNYTKGEIGYIDGYVYINNYYRIDAIIVLIKRKVIVQVPIDGLIYIKKE